MPLGNKIRWKECTCLFKLGLSFAIKIASSVLLKTHELASAKIFHWKVWPGLAAEWRAGSENIFVISVSKAQNEALWVIKHCFNFVLLDTQLEVHKVYF